MIPYVRASEPGDAEKLAPVLRESDLQEIKAASGRDPLVVLEHSFELSDVCNTIIDEDGEVAGMFGLVDISPGLAGIWMLGGTSLERPKTGLRFLRECHHWVAGMRERTPVLFNFVDARNTKTIRWLQWLGFEVANSPVPYGVEGRPFYMFQRTPNV